MDIRTGELKPLNEINLLQEDEKKHFVEVKRDLTEKEKSEMQIKMYSPCGCGSGKKFKFCCYKKGE